MPLIAVLSGPTASGKSALALRWAQARGLEILSADSRQVYRGFAIGTGAPTAQEQAAVPHHLVGHVDPKEPYSPQRFRAEAESLLKSRPNSNFIVVGGTGLYLKEWMHPSGEDRGEIPVDIRAQAALEIETRGAAAVHAGLVEKDPGGMAGVAPQDRYRVQKRLENWLFTGRSYVKDVTKPTISPAFEGVPFVWLDPPRADLHARIEARIRAMFKGGWIAEVESLRAALDPATTPAFNALGYREIADALSVGANLESGPVREEVFLKILARTRQYAKKQTTFLRHQFESKIPRAVAFSPKDLSHRLESSNWDAKSLFQD